MGDCLFKASDNIKQNEVVACICKNGGTRGGILREKLGISRIKIGKKGSIFENGCDFNDIVKRRPGIFKNAGNIGENAPRLAFDVIAFNFVGFGVDGWLGGNKNEIAIDDGLGVWKFGNIAFFAGKGLLFHFLTPVKRTR